MTAAPLAPAEINARLGRVIRTKRTQLGMSQEALGNRLGVTFQQVQKYEKGKNQVGFAMLGALAEALESTASELVASAMGEPQRSPSGVSERETLELIKRYSALPVHQRRGVRLLVQSMTEAA